MRKIPFVILLLLLATSSNAQWGNKDTLKNSLLFAKDDSTRFAILSKLFITYVYSNPDSSLRYMQEDLLLAQKMKRDYALFAAYEQSAAFASINGNYPEAIQDMLQSLRYAKQTNSIVKISEASYFISEIYRDEGDYEHAIYYDSIATVTLMAHWTPNFQHLIPSDTLSTFARIFQNKAKIYEKYNRLDSAIKYATLYYNETTAFVGKPITGACWMMGNVYAKMSKFPEALNYYRQGLAAATVSEYAKDLMDNYNGMAKTYNKIGQLDSAIFCAKKVIELSKTAHYPLAKLDALSMLSAIYRSKNNIDSVARYLELTLATKDSLFSQQKVMRVQSLTFNEQLSQQELQQKIEQSELQYKNRLNIYILLAGLIILLILAAGLWRRNIYRKKSFAMLQKQKEEIDTQKSKVEQTLTDLKATQSQLIQSEKMASLGELTAGIAHEIQNPLNFVNNFSELSNELIDEMNVELEKGDVNEAKAIAKDVKQNLEKINHHGKRADAIVKGMLQHSRSSTGAKEATDINKLADEYLRLAYHGLRAKDKDFNATIKTDFDESIGNINIIPQDVGRVLLNLYNNAFYAVAEKKKLNIVGYEPTVSLSTKKSANQVTISVSDNGNGIPQNIVDKIFQPFFTTKPTGQGTGLGLSLSYDIVKAHGGEIKVETNEEKGTTFIIQLPNS